MEFDWDDPKADWVLAERGILFEEAAGVFADPNRLDFADTRHDYGEERRTTIGIVDGIVLAVAYTMRGEVCRLITARRASRKERRAYG